MPRTRKNYPPSLKAKVAVEAIKGNKTAAQIAQTFSVHPNLVACWKKQALGQLPEIFSNGHAKQQMDVEKDELRLHFLNLLETGFYILPLSCNFNLGKMLL